MKVIEVSASVTEAFMEVARAAWEADGKPKTFGQDLNAMATSRAIRKFDPAFGPKSADPKFRYTDEEWAKMLMTLKRGSNANAINNALHSTKEEEPKVMAGEYAKMV